jgi:serine/threonine protein kinase
MPLGMLGKYERLDVLGHGVSGIVYLAKDTLLNKQVALKVVDVQAGDMRRFLEEARVMDRLRHPNIVRVLSVDRIDGEIVIAMDYVRGQNLQDLLRAEGTLPIDRACSIAVQVLDALDFAHRMQTVHRDIKPANILIGRDGEVKLADFGLAEILATNAYAGGAGTYAYMAPEDFAEEDRSDHQSDIWAVGVTLFEMLTGHRPFNVLKVKDPFAWKRVVESEEPTPLAEFLPDAPPALQYILDRALAREKSERYDSAGAFRDDLEEFRAGRQIATATSRIGGQTATRRLNSPDDAVSSVPRPPFLPPMPQGGVGVVVADVNAPSSELSEEFDAGETMPERRRKLRAPFLKRQQETRLTVDPQRVDFGSVRKGDLRSLRVQAKVSGVEGDVQGRVIHTPGWLTVHPQQFDKTRQTITLTAHTARAWETGDFVETVRVETAAGTEEIPVRVTVLKPRPPFWRVAGWYLPLFTAALAPVGMVAMKGSGHAMSSLATSALVPSMALATALLCGMLFLIALAADLNIGERLAPLVVVAAMCGVMGVAVAQPNYAATARMPYLMTTGGMVGTALLLQMLHARRWKLWAVVLLALGGFIGWRTFVLLA